VVTVPFPFIEKDKTKRRPALIISDPSLAKEFGFYWLLMITSKTKEEWLGDVEIKSLTKAGLPKESVIRTAKLATVTAETIIAKRGEIALAERKKILNTLHKWLPKP
jgi:mRNA interferase MazF